MLNRLINSDIEPGQRRKISEWRVASDTFIKLVRILPLMNRFWTRRVFLSLFSLVFIPLGLLNPYLSQRAVDGPLMNKSVEQFIQIGFWMGVISLSTMMLQNYYSYLQSRLGIDAREYITQKLYSDLTRMSLDFFRRGDRNAHAGILGADGVDVAVQAMTLIPEIAIAVLSSAVKLVVVFVIDWRLGLIALLSPPLYALQSMILARRNREVARVEREAGLVFSKELADSIGNMDLVKSFRSEEYHAGRFSKALKNLSGVWTGNQKFALYFGWGSGVLRKLVDGLPVIFASYLVTRGSLSLGQMAASVLYTMQFMDANAKLIDYIPRLGQLSVSANIFTDFMRLRPTVAESPTAREVVFEGGAVTVENVSFSYVPGTPVLKKLSLRIPGNRWTGIKAPSGFGKTTLLNLIVRVYDPESGRVLIDGHDIREIKFKSLKDQIGIVLQQSFLTRDPIWKCIAYDKEDATRAEIEEAARIAGIHDQILGFAQGYDTSCGDAGLNVSQGQRQRLTIARALIRRPRILIMDEAFGSVDRETEDKIVSDIRAAFPAMTVIVVSHNQAVLDKMDAVIDLTKVSAAPAERLGQMAGV